MEPKKNQGGTRSSHGARRPSVSLARPSIGGRISTAAKIDGATKIPYAMSSPGSGAVPSATRFSTERSSSPGSGAVPSATRFGTGAQIPFGSPSRSSSPSGIAAFASSPGSAPPLFSDLLQRYFLNHVRGIDAA
ncbi:hypothetical protein GQ55_2G141900 [Panicum hallii var. hallii]|uniref:Uncharacterized protein n=1 Tax=Panicum hallii var. hallii TaxID=1504633 RepID=A0A2T7EPQ2_9POAL|nr:hypothetical protein GQ55_2G141900 [Panicum hallii var. hallii]